MLFGTPFASAAEFPASSTQWINSAPLSRQGLEGKAALLWFFEEDCPRCRDKWPELLKTAQEFEGQPIVFIAVNSGSTRREIEQYARQNKVTWPVIVDQDRQWEKALGVTEISLNNITQVKLLMPNGEFQTGRWNDVKGSAERALQGAAFKVDPEGIPASMKPVWIDVEFGRYAQAATLIKRSLNSSKEDVKAAAEKLDAHIQAELAAKLKSAEEAKAKEEFWAAYKMYEHIADQFAGHENAVEASKQAKLLSKERAVVEELAAQKQLALALTQIRSANRTQQMRGLASLKRIAERADSETGAEAKQLLDQLSAGEK
jgi:thiol-disulfide isomerase/thioredoxin